VIVALVLAAWPASPQDEGERAGFWLSFGGGGGMLRSMRAATFYARMGGTPNRRLQFGAQVMNWWRENDADYSGVSVGVTAAFFPWDDGQGTRSPFEQTFLRAGFGPVTMGHLTGIGPTFGFGTDLHLNGNLHVTPNLDMVLYFLADATYVSAAFTLGLSWH
jgi:hypothetical protein